MVKLQGIFASIPTPFDHSGELWKVKVQHNVSKWNLTALSGYLVSGSEGEGTLLSFEEKIRLWEWVAESAAPGKLLIAGALADGVQETVRLIERAAELGYQAAWVQAPRLPVSASVYFRAVADRSKTPILVPCEDFSGHPNILPGLHGSVTGLVSALQAGAHGAVLDIASAVPYACISIWEAYRTREMDAALDWENRLSAAHLVAEKYGPPGLKHAMDLGGYYGGPPRLPFTVPSPDAKREIEAAFADLRG